MKYALTLSSLLFFTLTILLTFQYEAFSLEKSERAGHFTYNQEIEVTFESGTLHIIHHFTGLPENRLAIRWPANSGQAACASGAECERLAPDLSSLMEGEEGELSISYDIPGESTGSVMLRTPFVTIQGGEIGQTLLHITDRQKSGGTWLSGLPLIGQQTMNFVDYFLFAGEGNVEEIYWQSDRLSLAYKNNTVSLYSREMPSDKLKETLSSITFPKHVDIVVGQEHRTGTNRILFVRGSDETLERDLAIATIQSSYRLNREEPVLLSVMANMVTDQLEGNSRAIAMTNELKSLTEEQSADFLNKFWQQSGKELDAGLLDSILGEVLHGSVSFFERNVNEEPFFPLVKDDTRNVSFGGEPMEIDVIRIENRTFYSLAPLMGKLQYSMREGEHGLYLDNGLRSFRFPLDEPFYVLNERRYDAPTEPIMKIAGNYYIDEKWLILLFLLDVNKGEQQIRIERMEGF